MLFFSCNMDSFLPDDEKSTAGDSKECWATDWDGELIRLDHKFQQQFSSPNVHPDKPPPIRMSMMVNGLYIYLTLDQCLRQALHNAQLSTTKPQANARAEIHRSSSGSAASSIFSTPPLGTDRGTEEIHKELKNLGTWLFILCSPWLIWKISGLFIAELPTEVDQSQPEILSDIPVNNMTSHQILLNIPEHLCKSFLSSAGQQLVSSFPIYSPCIPSWCESPKINQAMHRARSSYVHHLHSVENKIFGFSGNFFDSKFDCSTVLEFQILLSVKITPKGKCYPMFPPILYLNDSMNLRQLFLNPMLTKVER